MQSNKVKQMLKQSTQSEQHNPNQQAKAQKKKAHKE
jgi:hypothetical protein